MHPEFNFSVFGSTYTVQAYDVFSILAIISAAALAPFLLRRAGLRPGKGLAFTILLLVIFIAGARLLNYAVNPLQYGNLMQVWSLHFTGFSLYGGVIAAGLALPVLVFLFRCNLWKTADALTLPAGISFVLARVGCFLNGCCAGKVTNSALGVVFPAAERETELLGKLVWLIGDPAAVRVWPTQIFEAGLAVAGLVLILPLSRRLRLAEGSAALLYAVWFTAARWAVLPLRSLPYDSLVTGVLYPVLYGTIILTCAVILYVRSREQSCRRRGRPREVYFEKYGIQ